MLESHGILIGGAKALQSLGKVSVRGRNAASAIDASRSKTRLSYIVRSFAIAFYALWQLSDIKSLLRLSSEFDFPVPLANVNSPHADDAPALYWHLMPATDPFVR